MNTKATLVIVTALVIGLGGAATFSWVRGQQPADNTSSDHGQSQERHDHDEADHTGHDHGEADHTGLDLDEDEHAGHDDDEHGEHDEETLITLSDQERSALGISVATATSGSVTRRIKLPGAVVLNADRVAHIVPRAPGIVREVLKDVGDALHEGEVIAWLESAELGDAKVDYLAKWSELGCCTIDLARARDVHDNTVHFLSVLEGSPSLEVLRETQGKAMGDYRSELVSAYAELTITREAYQRETRLLERKVASESEHQTAEAEYKKADALYAAKRDSIAFAIQRDLLEAEQALRVRKMEVKGAERRLYVLGLTRDDIHTLELLAQQDAGAPEEEHVCTDPNCTGCAADAASGHDAEPVDLHAIEEKLAWYPLRAPFDATVIDKHLTLGEKHGDDSDAFTVADLSSVWVDISVYQKDLPYVKKGEVVQISAGKGTIATEGVISFVGPTIDQTTRTALARVVLPNPDGLWRPGLFVTAELSEGGETVPVVVPKKAVQQIEGESVLFVEEHDGFKAVPVSLGRSDRNSVEVLAGLKSGQRYVVNGGFELKAKIVTSGMDAHAGHGH